MALAFRQRIFAWLVVIAAIPAAIAIAVAMLSPQVAAPVGGSLAWERAADSWRAAREALDDGALPPDAARLLERHNEDLSISLRRARQAEAIRRAFSGTLAAVAIALAVLVAGGAVRLAGHLSRQLSRPIDELLEWTARLRRGEPLPDTAPARGAPEFAVLRDAFRATAAELDAARAREVEAAQLRTFRDMSRHLAHELKNPLTPMRFAVERLTRDASAEQREMLEIIDAESARIEQMAREFTVLGRLPEGPPAPVDMAELLGELARGLPDGIAGHVVKVDSVPMVVGHYEPLRRAFHNLVINACDAIAQRTKLEAGHQGEILLSVRHADSSAPGSIEVSVTDNGAGIASEHRARIFEPYMTTKPLGTGLGLAIVRQTVLDHGGSIRVDSEPGRGATFTVTLPVLRS